jgi:hypothetical protein
MRREKAREEAEERYRTKRERLREKHQRKNSDSLSGFHAGIPSVASPVAACELLRLPGFSQRVKSTSPRSFQPMRHLGDEADGCNPQHEGMESYREVVAVGFYSASENEFNAVEA